MRGLLLIAIIFALLPVCVARPWLGILGWSWLGFMNPHRLTWGFAFNLPFAQMVALATIAGLLFTKARRPLPRTPEVYLLFALWGTFLLSTLGAVYQEDAWGQFNKVSKILFMTLVTLVLFQEARKFKALVWVIALSIGFFGLKGGIWIVLTGGRSQVLGPEGSFIEGNTEIGLALNMVLPLLVFLRREESRPWLRHLLLATFGFSIFAILGTYSRGAFLGLAVVLLLLVLKSRAKLMAGFLVAAALIVAGSILPPQWFERMETMRTYEEDNSARGRIAAWHVAYRIGLDRPLLGAGFSPFTEEMYLRYYPDAPGIGADAHNIFLQVLAEHGFTGLALYAALVVSTLLRLRSIVRKARPETGSRWIRNCAEMLQASIIGYVVCGWFLSRSYFDLFYALLALTVLLHVLVQGGETRAGQVHAPHY